MTSLVNILNTSLAEKLKIAHSFNTVETIKYRVLQHCAKILNVDFDCNPHLIRIPEEYMIELDKIWQMLLANDTKLSHNDYNAYKIIKMYDYTNILDLQKILKVFIKKNQSLFVNELLAIDGFRGYNINNYIDNINCKDNHITTIRSIYKNMKVSVKMVHLALLYVYDYKIMLERKINLENEIMPNKKILFEIIKYYEFNILNLKDIAQNKADEIKSLVDHKRRLEILHEDHQEKHPKKVKVKFIE